MAILLSATNSPSDEGDAGGPGDDPSMGRSGYGLNLLFRLRRWLGWYGPGYLRLKGELAAYRAEFECLQERAAKADIEAECFDRGASLLDAAQNALTQGEIEQGWYFVHGAKRLEVTGLEALDDQVALRTRARELLDQAVDGPETRATRTVQHLLTDQDGQLVEQPAGSEVRTASALMHEHHQGRHLKRQHLQQQFNCLLWLGVLGLATFLALGTLADHPWTMPLPVIDWTLDATAVLHSPFASLSTSETASIGFVVYVPLAGILGATLFGMRSLRKQARSGQPPQHLTGCWVALTRVMIGAIAAMVVFGFVRSGLVMLPETVSSASALLTFAFAAGHTEWLAPTAADAAAKLIEDASNAGG